ncbi:MAG: hypothetical protein KC442_17505 [Thermomicrobiales bacterium]|nr:hypothetical protein [Thermomicrobiales bacterium]
MKLSRFIMGSAVAASLVGAGMLATPASAQDCGVAIYGGDVMNVTSVDISANAGTSISDSSAGSYNAATTSSNHDGLDTASAGNGGVATSAANGGAIAVGDVNSGGNVGNAVVVGNTDCGVGAWEEPVYEEEVYEEEYAAEEEVIALPETGVGGVDFGSLAALAGAAGAAAASFGLRRR